MKLSTVNPQVIHKQFGRTQPLGCFNKSGGFVAPLFAQHRQQPLVCAFTREYVPKGGRSGAGGFLGVPASCLDVPAASRPIRIGLSLISRQTPRSEKASKKEKPQAGFAYLGSSIFFRAAQAIKKDLHETSFSVPNFIFNFKSCVRFLGGLKDTRLRAVNCQAF